MKLFIQRACVVYGCLALLASTTWLVVSWFFEPALPASPGPVLVPLGIHGLILTLTFQPFVGPEPFWSPVWRISPRRRMWARSALACAAILCVGSAIWCVVLTRESHDEDLIVRAAILTIASLAILSSLYIVLHWAFRPENLFSESFIEFASNPLGYLLIRLMRR